MQLPARSRALRVRAARFDLRGSDYVTLCDYSAIPVTITGDYDVDDQKVKGLFQADV